MIWAARRQASKPRPADRPQPTGKEPQLMVQRLIILQKGTVKKVNYIVRRVGQTLGVLLAVSVICFLLVRVAPGDPAEIILSQSGVEPSQAAIAQLHVELGLDEPLPVQYALWMQRVARFDLGRSFRTKRPVGEELLARLPATLTLGLAAWALGIAIALPLGVVAAVRPNGWVDRVGRFLAMLGASIPSFWLGLILIYIFAVQLRLLPAMGRGDLRHYVLPAFTLAVGIAGTHSRLLRASMLEVVRADYVRTARAKGLAEAAVIWQHALRNALLPLVTATGMTLSRLWGGAVIVETVFGWPGIGKFVVDSIFLRDYQAVQGFVLLMAVTVTIGNLLVDLTYRWLDPRIRLSDGGNHA
jgi:peptide/nickel transport system permease protein